MADKKNKKVLQLSQRQVLYSKVMIINNCKRMDINYE